MAGLQRSAVSFRRQGSSGLVWDDRFLSGELNKVNNNQKDEAGEVVQQGGQEQQEGSGQEHQRDQIRVDAKGDVNNKPGRSITTMERSRSNGGGRGYRTGRVSPAIEPPSPRVSACGFCSAFAKPSKNKLKKSGKRRSR